MKLLCLSNGHGEDAIAVRILRELQQQPNPPELAVLPLVGEGRAYAELEGVPMIAPVKKMPSGGFIYMDSRQLWRDVQGGLLDLTWNQLQAVRAWAQQGGSILAVGDIVPLLFAWWSGANYAFVGTAKSEYYLRDEAGLLPNRSWFEDLESWSGSVYLPWERWLMRHRRCKAVFPRDPLTTETLQKFSIPAFDLGNPMMDELEPAHPPALFYDPDAELKETRRPLIVTLLPGSRAPEAYDNWQKILQAVAQLCQTFAERTPVFLAAISPGLSLDIFCEKLEGYYWQAGKPDNLPVFPPISDPAAVTFTQGNATLILSQNAFIECLQPSDLAIAMAGTATEQYVGLGKPAFAFPGVGPQFTPAFAEAQSRLLGPSLILLDRPTEVAIVLRQLLRDPDRLQLIADNGLRRMGEPGAASRIVACLSEKLLTASG
ncbi:lipid-A-disaccharide synthase-related protein [Microcoleus sp. FACHB-68]|uniref:lipid-A-disaccharide synthase-related protein n=1 Tax=Microcoleus sp. FACHB-68 TaxID=2692826 RepID=UPI00168923FE|nr:lipid-A-disaccharide synthase-related protein [Microcoleus sp. FACHB-68]MBD1936617.1 hypothetical protein [Microcoleus sp. FACHB-68]